MGVLNCMTDIIYIDGPRVHNVLRTCGSQAIVHICRPLSHNGEQQPSINLKINWMLIKWPGKAKRIWINCARHMCVIISIIYGYDLLPESEFLSLITKDIHCTVWLFINAEVLTNVISIKDYLLSPRPYIWLMALRVFWACHLFQPDTKVTLLQVQGQMIFAR
jgi:hypothetical protein